MQEKNIKAFTISLVAITIFTMLIFTAGYAYFSSSITLNVANYNLNLPQQTMLVCTKSDCNVDITIDMMGSGNTSSSAKGTCTASVTCTCSGTPGAECNYNLSLLEAGESYIPSSGLGNNKEFTAKITSGSGCSEVHSSGTETQYNNLREKVVSSCSLTVPQAGSISSTVTADIKWYNLNLNQDSHANRRYTTYLSTEYSLPDEYQEVAYLQSNGTQSINTGIIADNTTGAHLYFGMTNTGGDTVYFGSRAASADTRFWIGYSSRMYVGFNTNHFASSGFTNGTEHSASINFYNNHKKIVDNEEVGTIDVSLASQTVPITIFAGNVNGTVNYKSSYRLYRFRITSGSQLIASFVPCYRKSDNVKGLYDVIRKRFYTDETNASSFVVGSNVN